MAHQRAQTPRQIAFGVPALAGLLLLLTSLICNAQSPADAIANENAANAQLAARYQQSLKDQAELERLQQIEFQTWMPADPWRAIDGQTNYARGPGWKQFVGKVIGVSPEGIHIEGTYGEPDRTGTPAPGATFDFFVKGFPYIIADEDSITPEMHFTAHETDQLYTYTTIHHASRTIHQLIYGAPAPIPAHVLHHRQQLTADAQAKAAKEKTEGDQHALQWNQQQAAAGDPYGLLRMGQRYEHGEGVETNLVKARDYLTRSAAAGNETAKDELAKLQN